MREGCGNARKNYAMKFGCVWARWEVPHQVLTRAKRPWERVAEASGGPILGRKSKTFIMAISPRGAVETARKTKPTWGKDVSCLKTFLLRRFCKNSG